MADNFHPVPVFEETYTPGGLLSAVRLPLGTILRLRFQDVEAAPGLHLGTGESGFRVYPGREHAEACVALAVSTSIACACPGSSEFCSANSPAPDRLLLSYTTDTRPT